MTWIPVKLYLPDDDSLCLPLHRPPPHLWSLFHLFDILGFVLVWSIYLVYHFYLFTFLFSCCSLCFPFFTPFCETDIYLRAYSSSLRILSQRQSISKANGASESIWLALEERRRGEVTEHDEKQSKSRTEADLGVYLVCQLCSHRDDPVHEVASLRR